MKQFQFEYTSVSDLKKDLDKIRISVRGIRQSCMVFHIYSELLSRDTVSEVCKQIKLSFPHALYLGCSTSGNIMNGSFYGSDIVVICTVFEYETTRAEIMQFELSNEAVPSIVDTLTDYVSKNPWVKTIELLTTLRGMSMTEFCEKISNLPPHIKIFGGGAFSPDMGNAACVFSGAGGYSSRGVVFLMTGGDDYHTYTTSIVGWKPLGRVFRVTSAKKNILYELDGKPAFDTYYKYLHIKNNEHFFINSLEFPFIYESEGIMILRAPTACNPDGSLVMTSDIEENVDAHLSFGDPVTILDCVRESGLSIQTFRPDVISVFSCAARRTFWGNEDVSSETVPLDQIAPTFGFYTSGEFLRTGKRLIQHNVTLVLCAQREGDREELTEEEIELYREENFTGRVSMIQRLATFIDAATQELEEANQKLAYTAVTDGLTGLYNRSEIQRRITSTARELGSGDILTLAMIDIDNFKSINDTYGHDEGDCVIRRLSGLLRNISDSASGKITAGRWGGEEFMLMIEGSDAETSRELVEKLRAEFSAITFEKAGNKTFSAGVTQSIFGEDVKTLCMRVDDALYEAKRTGKNKTVIF